MLQEQVAVKGELEDYLQRLKKKREFLDAWHGMSDEKQFLLLQGYCPLPEIEKVVSLAKKYDFGYLVAEPDNIEETPTYITNPKWINIINPVFRFMNTVPGYNEFDISLVFLVFFSVFFAMLIGDAGYGCLFLVTTWLVRRKFKTAPKQPFFLMYLLSTATIVWGAITGTWFGVEKIAELHFFNLMVIQKISSFADDNQSFMVYLCFIIGIIHLTTAHLMKAIRCCNSLRVLAQVGWLGIMWGLFFLAGKLVIARPFPAFAGYLLIAGILLALFFTNPQKNILKGLGDTLVNLPLTIISSFADIVSYLRLFAVGYASVIVATSFNSMAQSAGFNSVLSGLVASLILIAGHLLNITLGFMAVIVHGIRLNMLEFSGHLDMQWSGKEYKPFKESNEVIERLGD